MSNLNEKKNLILLIKIPSTCYKFPIPSFIIKKEKLICLFSSRSDYTFKCSQKLSNIDNLKFQQIEIWNTANLQPIQF